MDEELKGMLIRYQSGHLSVADLVGYVEDFDIWSAAQDGDTRIRALRGPVGRLELSATEVLEGLRPEQSLRDLVEDLLQKTCSGEVAVVRSDDTLDHC